MGKAELPLGFPGSIPCFLTTHVLFGPTSLKPRLMAWAALGGFVGILAGQLAAQDPPAPPGTSKPFPSPRLPEGLPPGLRPDVYFLKNEQGEDVVVPRTSYEEFERLLRESRTASAEPTPPPTLSQLDLLVEPDVDYARVSLTATTKLAGPTKAWSTIPIALGQLQWLPATEANATEAASSMGEVTVASQANGYAWRVPPGAERERTLRLNAVCKLTTSNNGYSVRLDLPPAASVIRLRLPAGEWELSASGSGNEVVEPFRTVDDASVAIVRTTANSVNLAWNRKTEREGIVAIEATSQTKFAPSVDGSQLRAVSTIALRGPTQLGGTRFAVTLPPMSQLRDTGEGAVGFSGYRINRRVVESDAPNDEAPNTVDTQPTVLEIDIDETFARSELEIPIEWQVKGTANPEALSFLAPTIEGVQRHVGSIECLIPRTVLFDWTAVGETRLQRQNSANDGSDSLVYSFQFDRQPAGVQCRWQSLSNRPRMRSSHTIDVEQGRALMRGSIEFLSDPLQLPLLQLEVTNWNIESLVVHPTQLEIDPTTALELEGGSKRSIPIHASYWLGGSQGAASGGVPESGGILDTPGSPEERSSSPMASSTTPVTGATAAGTPGRSNPPSIRLDYVLSQPLSWDANPLEFALPQLSWLTQESQQRTHRTLSGLVTISSWAYRLNPSDESFPGMRSVVDPDRSKTSVASVSALGFSPYVLAYQAMESADPIRWAGSRQRRASSTSATYEASPVIQQDRVTITHRWICRSYGSRPASLMVGLIGSGTAEESSQWKSIAIDGAPVLTPQLEAPRESLAADRTWLRLEVPIAAADTTQRSEFLVEVITEHPIAWSPSGQSRLDLVLPILQASEPSDVFLVESADLRNPHSLGVAYRLEASATLDAMDNDGPENGEGRTGDSTPMLVDAPRWICQLTRMGEQKIAPVQFEAEWLQTILNAIYQRDRYVARFSTHRDYIDLHLPSELRKEAEFILDGKRVFPSEIPTEPDRIRIAWDAGKQASPDTDTMNLETGTRHVLEVFTLRPSPSGWVRRIPLTTPRLESDASNAPLLWQVIVPRTEHLFWNSAQLTPQYQWRWKDLFLARDSDLSQERIEGIMGATQQTSVTPNQTNRYDLQTVTGTHALHAWFLPRSLIWLPVAVLVLLMSITMGGSRWVHQPGLWGALLVGFLLFSQWAWDVSILVAQTTLAALSIAIAYRLMRWLFDRRARRRSIFVNRPTSMVSASNPRSSPSATSPSATVDSPPHPSAVETSNIHAAGDGA